MQSERQRVAAQARAEGAEASPRIRADAERERTVLLADARATADKLRGEGEAEATRIFAKAFEQDPEFFSIWRTLQGYRDAFDTGNVAPGSDARTTISCAILQAPPAPADAVDQLPAAARRTICRPSPPGKARPCA